MNFLYTITNKFSMNFTKKVSDWQLRDDCVWRETYRSPNRIELWLWCGSYHMKFIIYE